MYFFFTRVDDTHSEICISTKVLFTHLICAKNRFYIAQTASKCMGTANTEMQICNNSIMSQSMSRLMQRVFIFESDQSVWRFTLITHSHEPLSLDRRNGRQWDTKASWCLGGTFTYSCIHWASGGLVCVCVFIDLCLPPAVWPSLQR